MSEAFYRLLAVLLLCASLASVPAEQAHAQAPKAEIGFVEIDPDLTLRRMIVRSPRPNGTVLLLHGFPETLYAWKDIALALGQDYDVHAIDWPGYGLSSRPGVDRFSYAPRDYARVLRRYIERAEIDRAGLTIYATDIGALPVLLAALEDPGVARGIIVGDFAPFDRPQYMYESLQGLKSPPPLPEQIRAQMNRNRDEILENAFKRGLPVDAQFEVSPEFRKDMARGWGHGEMSSADAFYHYYSHFTRDQDYLEANLAKLRTPLKIVWGERDIYIKKEMGTELAEKTGAPLTLLPGVGHYPHLQSPERTIEEIRVAMRPSP